MPFGKLDYAHVTLPGFGADIEVLDPRELRSLMVATAAAVAALCTERQPARAVCCAGGSGGHGA
jgi:hypothetical protein